MSMYHLEHPCSVCRCPDIVVNLSDDGLHFLCTNCMSSWHVVGAGFDDRMDILYKETYENGQKLELHSDEETGVYYW